MYGYEHVGMGWGGLGMVLIWAILIILAVPLISHFTGNHEAKSEKSARGILEARYAQGEIEHAEYVKRRADLEA